MDNSFMKGLKEEIDAIDRIFVFPMCNIYSGLFFLTWDLVNAADNKTKLNVSRDQLLSTLFAVINTAFKWAAQTEEVKLSYLVEKRMLTIFPYSLIQYFNEKYDCELDEKLLLERTSVIYKNITRSVNLETMLSDADKYKIAQISVSDIDDNNPRKEDIIKLILGTYNIYEANIKDKLISMLVYLNNKGINFKGR